MAVSAASPVASARGRRRGIPAPVAVALRAFADSRVRNGSFAALFLFSAYAQAAGYRSAYPTLQDRLEFARSFGANKALRLFYGVPHDLLSVGGYSAWRVGGTMSILAAVWGVLAAVRALRAEEDAGRAELVLAGVLGRGAALAAMLSAVAAGALLLWAALLLGLYAGGLPLGGSAYLALATVSVAPVFAAAGALICQLAPNGRLAIGAGAAAVVASLLLRVVADTANGLAGLRWATPLGWAEELRAFAGPHPWVLALPVLMSVLLLVPACLMAVRRDVGNSLLQADDSRPPRLTGLGSPLGQALRDARGGLAAWAVGVGFYAVIIGLLANSFSSATISSGLQRELRKLSGASVITPSGALGFYFLFFVLAVSLFVCWQIAAIRREEADQRLETLFALPVSRRGWLAGRLLLAAVAAAALALAAGLLAWAGAASQGADVGLPGLLEAGANCLPTALLFLALGTLAFALVPRASAGIAYGLVVVSFLWQLFGSLLSAPRWLLDLTPFAHVGLVPAQAFRGGAAAVMLAIAAAAALAGLWAFGRRDLAGS